MAISLQLQHLIIEDGDKQVTNAGGLYLNAEEISEIFYDKLTRTCHICMNNGHEYIVAQSISEVLDELARLGKNGVD